jgi:hypothetical protein
LLEDRGKPRKPVSRRPVAGPSGCILTTSQQSGSFEAECHLKYLNIQSLLQRKQLNAITKIDWLVLVRKIIAVKFQVLTAASMKMRERLLGYSAV